MMMPRTAMLLAAGRGTRLRALGEDRPKPLVEVGGKALIDHALDMLTAAGVRRIVVNTHHRAESVEAHLARRTGPEILISREAALLETGGGVKNALPLLGDHPFFVMNSDSVWGAASDRPLRRLGAAWDAAAMDALLLLHPTVRAVGYAGPGDFMCDPLGRLTRRPERLVAPFLFAGVQILHPRLFAAAPDGSFSLNLLYDRAQDAGRLYGIVHDGIWLDAGTPERLDYARNTLGYSIQGQLL